MPKGKGKGKGKAKAKAKAAAKALPVASRAEKQARRTATASCKGTPRLPAECLQLAADIQISRLWRASRVCHEPSQAVFRYPGVASVVRWPRVP